jgi:hypothetical protein
MRIAITVIWPVFGICRLAVMGRWLGGIYVPGGRPDCPHPGSEATRQIVGGTGMVFESDRPKQGHPGPAETGSAGPGFFRQIKEYFFTANRID